ncbi:MAG: hypothetical protein PVJ65_02270 [Chromatiales bacterium]
MNIQETNRYFTHGNYLDSGKLSRSDIELLHNARHYWEVSDSYHFGECAYEYLVGKLNLDDEDEIVIRQFLNTASNGEMPIRQSSLLDRFMNSVTLAAVEQGIKEIDKALGLDKTELSIYDFIDAQLAAKTRKALVDLWNSEHPEKRGKLHS